MRKTIKKFIYITCIALAFTACDDKLEITPKGQTTLETVDDLALLLNQEYDLMIMPFSDLGLICDESLGGSESVSEMLSQTKTLNYAYLTYDEKVDRATLSQQDARYEALYKYINYMNVILDKADDASGDNRTRATIKAQAQVLRAYFHYLLVNIYAAQYDPATASKKGGVPYVTDIDVSKRKEKLNLQDTYDHILADCSDEVIAQLPKTATDVTHPSQATGNAIRAKVLLQMKKYQEALPYAQAALQLNGQIEDRSTTADNEAWVVAEDSPNNYLIVRATARICPFMETASLETMAKFENGDYVRNYDSMGWSEMFGQMTAGINGCASCFATTACTTAYGINADRTYYLAAECLIRTGKIREGLALVDKVRNMRVEDCQNFTDLYDEGGMSEKEAMQLLQKAKWIECLGSYENFFDCKRWNSEEGYKQTITRNLGEDLGSYSISPESSLWVLPFPSNAVRYNPTLTQNY